MKTPLLVCCILVAACSGGSGQPTAPTTNGAEEPQGSGEPAGQESEHDRLARELKAKRAQCDALGTQIEQSETGEAIVNLNDSQKLRDLARKREKAARGVGALDITVEQLTALRDRYVKLSRDMAAALGETADGSSAATKKKALKRYAELDTEVGSLVEEFNSFCGAPVTEGK